MIPKLTDKRDLARLYPTPKTYADLRADRQRRELRRIERLPRHAPASVGLHTVSIAILVLACTTFLSKFIMYNVIAGVFTTFLAALGISAYLYVSSGSIVRMYELHGRRAHPALSVSYTLLTLWLVFCISGAASTSIGMSMMLLCTMFVVVCITSYYVMHR